MCNSGVLSNGNFEKEIKIVATLIETNAIAICRMKFINLYFSSDLSYLLICQCLRYGIKTPVQPYLLKCSANRAKVAGMAVNTEIHKDSVGSCNTSKLRTSKLRPKAGLRKLKHNTSIT